MQNRPLPSYSATTRGEQSAVEGPAVWNWRLVALFGCIALAFTAIGLRLAWIQTQLTDEYVSEFDFTRVEFEVIPGRDGRILTDSLVLASDIVRYDVEAHYRWLEDPPNPDWLSRRARLKVPRGQRGDTARMEAARESVLAERRFMWTGLAAIAGLDQQELRTRRRAIQTRVERIAESVNRRHEAQAAEETPQPAAGSGLAGTLERLRQQLSSPPRRRRLAPIIVQEELDYHAVAGDVPLAVAAEIRAHPELYPGLRVQESTTRVYPRRTLAAHVIGTRSREAGSETSHRIGRSGVERSYDGQLRGIDGRRKVTYNRRGEIVRSEVVREPISGRDVVLTLDSGLQRSAESLLDEALDPAEPTGENDAEDVIPPGGCIIVLDVHSGELITLASAPRFDLNLLVKPDPAIWKKTIEDPRHPLFPRATQMTVPPGSVFKVLTAVAMLEGSGLDPAAHRLCRGYLDRPDRHRCYIYRHFGVGHGQVDLRAALAQSCNVYFFEAARQMGPEPMVRWARRLGFGQPTGVDLPFERGGNLPTPQARRSGPRWYPGDTLGLAIGQSRLTATPLQIARMMAAISNGGYLITPRVVDESGLNEPQSSWTTRPRHRVEELSAATLEQIQQGMFAAVQDPGGTGYDTVRLDAVSVAGKSGTAESGGGRPDHAWFAGYVPAGRPAYAFVVMLEHGGSGGKAAGPVARHLIQAMISEGLLESTSVAQR